MGARDLLRDYFLRNLGKVLESDELRLASGGISEWARRIRELRNEEGFQILRDCQDFRVWAGIMGKKESHYVPTQRTGDTG